MTCRRRDGNEAPFDDWLRRQPQLDSVCKRLSIMDTDKWIHKYRSHQDKVGLRSFDSLMHIELKIFRAYLAYAQSDTFLLLQELHKQKFMRPDGRIAPVNAVIRNEKRQVRHYGHHLLRLEKDRPDNGWIEWNRILVTEEQLIKILVFEIDPRNLNPISDRRHHINSNPCLELDFRNQWSEEALIKHE